MKVLLTGVNGQLGKTIALTKPDHINLIQISRKELDLEKPEDCFDLISSIKPEWVINAAAYTQVDLAENNINRAYKINYEAPKQFAKALSLYGGNLLQISTDFVFDGRKKTPYKPTDKINPINVYGKSKAAGEQVIQEILGIKNLSTIIRTSWLMSPFGNNFALTILKLIKQRERISIVNDQFGSPTTCRSLAKTCWELIKFKFKNKSKETPEILHWSNIGSASWYEVARLISNLSKEKSSLIKCEEVLPINTGEFKFNAERPKYSVLDSTLTSRLLNINNNTWENEIKYLLTNNLNLI